MRFLVTPHGAGNGWFVLRVDGPRAVSVAFVTEENMALRVAQLLDRHGMEDVELPADLTTG